MPTRTPTPDETPSTDADQADPVGDYYAKKKKRYLKDGDQSAKDMTTGTPFDWEDSAGYAQPHDAGDANSDDLTDSTDSKNDA